MYAPLLTYKDLIDHGVDFIGSNVSGDAARDARRAVLSAYRNLPNEHQWTYYYTRGRLNSAQPFLDGTIQYQVSAGAVPRQVTLTTTDGGVWPTWAGMGTILIGNITYEIQQRISNSELQITAQSDPGVDIPAGTSYTLYQDIYQLPSDFIASDEWINASFVLALEYVHPNAWLARQRLVRGPATPYIYTFMSTTNTMGALAVRFYPPPDNVYSFDFIYKRRPRPLLIDLQAEGTVSVSQSGTTVTGVSTNWTASMVGSIIRFSNSTSELPTSLVGENPYQFENFIVAVNSATSLTIDTPAPQALAGFTYTISDPVDMEDGAMMTALLRGIEKELARNRTMKDRVEFANAYTQALILAREADARSFQRQVAGTDAPLRMRLAYMPRGADVS